MTAHVFADWCSENEVKINYIEPGKPNQNAYIERFNRSYREEVLDPHIFSNLSQVRDLSWAWMLSYNEERPHRSLGNIPPSVKQTTCAECGEPMLTIAQAAVMFGVKQSRIFQNVETGEAHSAEAEAGSLMICLPSLSAVLDCKS